MIDNIKLFNKSLEKYCKFLFLHSIMTRTRDKISIQFNRE